MSRMEMLVKRRKNGMRVQWSPTANPYIYLDAAKSAFREAAPQPREEELIEAVKNGLAVSSSVFDELIDPKNWSAAVKAERRRPRIMLDADLNQRGTFKIGYSLFEEPIFLGGEFDPWISQGTQAGWTGIGNAFAKKQIAHFNHVALYLQHFIEGHTNVHRYCALAALAEFERIKRILAFDLEIVAAPQFEQTWVDGMLTSIAYTSLGEMVRGRGPVLPE